MLREYETKILHLDLEAYKLHNQFKKDKPDEETATKLIALRKQRAKLAKEVKDYLFFTIPDKPREFMLLTAIAYLNHQKEIFKIFEYYDARERSYAAIPTSYYNPHPINRKLVRMPLALQRYYDISNSGYEISLSDLSIVVNEQTYTQYISNIREEKQENKPTDRKEYHREYKRAQRQRQKEQRQAQQDQEQENAQRHLERLLNK